MTFVTAEPYIGHLGVGGVGDTKGALESEMRQRHIKWIVNAKVDKVDTDKIHVTEVDEDGKPKKAHELPFKFSMMIPAFRGIAAVRGIDGGESARIHHRRQVSTQPQIPQRVWRRCLHCHRSA
jgi:sulfide:quinone oxidoreductase